MSAGVCVLFGAIATTTGHDHWERTDKQVKPIAEPLTRMLNSLPPNIVEMLGRHIDPALLAIGLYSVAAPSIKLEMQMRRENAPTPQRTPSASPPPTVAPPPMSAALPIPSSPELVTAPRDL